jgi:hypothetical protein
VEKRLVFAYQVYKFYPSFMKSKRLSFSKHGRHWIISLISFIHSTFPHIKIMFNIITPCRFMSHILYSVCEFPSDILRAITYPSIRAIFTTYLTLFDLITLTILYIGPGSSVGIATGYGLDGPSIESRCGRDFPHLSGPALGPTQTPVQWVQGLFRS